MYRARDTRLHRDVALKILPERFISHPERRARFELEAYALAALNHPNTGRQERRTPVSRSLRQGGR